MKNWIVFANANRCNHYKALKEIGFINWAKARNFKFEIGDIVYIFSSKERKIIFKTIVVADNESRRDSKYWVEETPRDITYRLEADKEYTGDMLSESQLMKYGFKGGRSLQTPQYKNTKLVTYISEQF